METSLRLRGADSTSGQQLGLRIHAKQKLPLAYNALLQAHAEIDTATRKPSLLALLARHFFPQLSANVGAGVQLERGNIFRYTLRAKKAVSFTDDGLLGLNIKGRLLADKNFKPFPLTFTPTHLHFRICSMMTIYYILYLMTETFAGALFLPACLPAEEEERRRRVRLDHTRLQKGPGRQDQGRIRALPKDAVFPAEGEQLDT